MCCDAARSTPKEPLISLEQDTLSMEACAVDCRRFLYSSVTLFLMTVNTAALFHVE